MSDRDQDWKSGLTRQQLQKVEELENSLAEEKAKSWQQEILDKSPSKTDLSNFVVRIHEASCDNLAMSSSPHPPVSCSPPTSPSSVLIPQPPTSVDTSPSLRRLNPGYVSSLAEFWANRWKIENNDNSEDCQEGHGHGLGNVNEADEGCQEVNRLKETIMIQCQLFRATEDENLKLKADIKNNELFNEKILKDLNHKSEIRESLLANLRDNLVSCNLKISKLIDQDQMKSYKIAELEEKLVSDVTEMDVVIQENLSFEKELSKVHSKFENVEEKNLKLQKELDKYEEIVRELKNQAVPVQNIKVKMASLDQDVLLLKRRLQSSVRSKSNISNISKKPERLTLPCCTSTKKRRWSPSENDPASPAKMIKTAETQFSTKPCVSIDTATEKSDEMKKTLVEKQSSSSVVEPTSSGKSVPIVKTRKLGRQMEDCKQQ